VNFRIPFILFALFLSAFAHADRCRDSVLLLGNEPGNGSGAKSALREDLLNEMASLYLEALQDSTLMQAFQWRLQTMASIEKRSEVDLYREIELLASHSTVRRHLREQREERTNQEQMQLISALGPYLGRLGREHREIIERELIFRGVVNPLTTGEVEFRFQGDHWFSTRFEGYSQDGSDSATKLARFGLGHDFAIGQAPVTQLMYFLAALGEEGVDPTPSDFKVGEGAVVLRLGDKTYHLKPNHPVDNVSAHDADAHARRASEITGEQYGLPSVLQWEFANRAGSKAWYHFGFDLKFLPQYGWFEINSGMGTQAIGQLLPNAFHLYDTHGNVWEWTAFSEEKYYRVLLGGSWLAHSSSLRSGYPSFFEPDVGDSAFGFRLVRQGPSRTPPPYAFNLGEPMPEATLGTSTALPGANP
jgi:formylglycine-generating enzyme required for sulfatase activity